MDRWRRPEAKTDTYVMFSVEETFYHSYARIRGAFVRQGFVVTPHSLELQYQLHGSRGGAARSMWGERSSE